MSTSANPTWPPADRPCTAVTVMRSDRVAPRGSASRCLPVPRRTESCTVPASVRTATCVTRGPTSRSSTKRTVTAGSSMLDASRTPSHCPTAAVPALIHRVCGSPSSADSGRSATPR